MSNHTIHHGDGIAYMRSLPDESVDAIITDPPYAITQIAWDQPVDWAAFWSEAYRVCKPHAVQAVFSAQPFTTDLITSNRKRFRYDLIWPKPAPTGFLDAKHRPLRGHEHVIVFAAKPRGTYNPQMREGAAPYRVVKRTPASPHYGAQAVETDSKSDGARYPTTVMPAFSRGFQPNLLHPTQKPVNLMTWLILTYTNEGDTVLDPFAGSGSTAVAAIQTGRRFQGAEIDAQFVGIARERCRAAAAQPGLFQLDGSAEPEPRV